MKALSGSAASLAIARLTLLRFLRSRVLLVAGVFSILPMVPYALGAGIDMTAEERVVFNALTNGWPGTSKFAVNEALDGGVAADPLSCTRDAEGRCTSIDPCFNRPDDDDCLSVTEERAWSSPIFVDQPRS